MPEFALSLIFLLIIICFPILLILSTNLSHMRVNIKRVINVINKK